MESKQGTAPDASIDKDGSGKTAWSSAVNTLNSWYKSEGGPPQEGANANRTKTKPLKTADDHLTTPMYGQSFRSYPKGCPPLRVQWFHAVDVPKRSTQQIPLASASGSSKNKQPAKPKKFTAFSKSDSVRIENQYQSLLESEEDGGLGKRHSTGADSAASDSSTLRDSAFSKDDASAVPVNEDFLFDVVVPNRELYPVYWNGPVYEVRRGTWFFQDGSSLRPCEENLAAQVEEGFLKTKPWKELEANQNSRKHTQQDMPPAHDNTPINHVKEKRTEKGEDMETAPKQQKLPSHRLFGPYMNSTVTYQDSNTAWLTSEGVLSWVTNSVYERFAGGGYMSGVKLVRGYLEQDKGKEKDANIAAQSKTATSDSALQDKPGDTERAEGEGAEKFPGREFMKRKLSTIMNDEDRRVPKTEDEVRKLNEEEMRHGYLTQSGESQGREIQHLILVTHGIGQRLSLRMQSVNFIHDVNVLRKTLKAVYANSVDLRALNHDGGNGPGNCRVQVLPVCWRHKLDFPKQRHKKPETDLADASSEDLYPSLEDITVDGVAFARSLISDLALDVLLYQSSYRDEIATTVTDESNRIVDLFRKRNPEFKGKVHVIGHSLGSAILFDILCQQNRPQQTSEDRMKGLRFWPSVSQSQGQQRPRSTAAFNFDVEDLYCLGSPTGLFQMLNGRTIAARPSRRSHRNELGPHSIEHEDFSPTVSSPDVKQLFNIFYPSDPISYRLEPLVASAMSKLKPHQLPYTKKGLFGAVRPQGLTEIGSKVGQSFSGLWSSLSTGLSGNFMPPSRKLVGEEAKQIDEDNSEIHTGPAKNASLGGKHSELNDGDGVSAQLVNKEGLAPDAISDVELETLYSKFYMYGQPYIGEGDQEEEKLEEDSESRKLRIAQKKVCDLNRNGRVDFSIQEGALDFNPISTIASHIGYWADEDVNHFILNQVLSRRNKS